MVYSYWYMVKGFSVKWFRAKGLGFRVCGLGFRIRGSGFFVFNV
jgi:hypothetical protein